MNGGKVVTFISSKGGSGKTVTAASLALLLGACGKKALLVDTDAATNGLTLLFLEEILKYKSTTLVSLNVGGVFDSSINTQPTDIPLSDAVRLIPATYQLKQTDDVPIELFSQNLDNICRHGRRAYDVILLDAQAGSDKYARIAASVADQVVIVSEYDPISAQGIDRLKIIFQDVLAIDRTWILFNKVLPEFVKSIGEGLEIARYLQPIPWDADVIKAFARRKLAIDTEFGNTYTLAIVKIAKRLFGGEIEKSINKWEEQASLAIREPSKAALIDLEKQIQDIERDKIKTEIKLRWMSNSAWIIVFLAGLLSFVGYYLGISNGVQEFVSVSKFSEFLVAGIPIILGLVVGMYGISRAVFQSSEIQLRSKIKEAELMLGDAIELRRKMKFLSEADIESIVREHASQRKRIVS